MGLYDLHKYLYALADDLNTENQKRLERLISATRNSQYFNYVSENLNTPPRYDENIGLASPPENREKRYASHRAPKQLPPRYDVRRYETESNTPKNKKTPSFYRQASVKGLPDKIASNIHKHATEEFKNKFNSLLIKKTASGDLVISKETFIGNNKVAVLSKDIKISKDSPDYNIVNAIWQKGKITNVKISMPIPAIEKTSSLGSEVNTHFYNLIKRARKNEKNI